MSFHPITVSAKTWNQVGPGKYMESTVVFGGEQNYILLSGGKYNPKTGMTTASVSNIWQSTQTTGTESKKYTNSVQQVIQVATGITVADIDARSLMLSDLITTSLLNRLLQGEQ